MPSTPHTAVFAAGAICVTACTERIWRLEWAADGRFADAPTLTVGERRPPAGGFAVERDGDEIVLRGAAIELRLREDGRPFHAGNCRASFAHGDGRGAWAAGDADRGNLGGARRTLDSFHANMLYDKGRKELVASPEEPGLLSRDGWTLHDDSAQPLLLPLADGRPWPAARPAGERRDWYLCCFGLDFRGGLAEAAAVFGAQPPPPRWALGLWISRWWAYTDQEAEEIVDEYRRHGCPVDVLVLDMEWHVGGWGGVTWESAFFPDHRRFLRELKARHGCRVALNLHPADGVGRAEPAFAPMAAQLGLAADAAKIPFDCADPAWVDAWFRHGLHPHEAAGVDLWWLDWQQGTASAIPGLDPLPWQNHLHWQDQLARLAERGGERPLGFSRFGGLGGGRMPIGFSGDTESSWRTLRYLVRFTAASAHSLYGQWSHDVGGFFNSPWEGLLTAELYLRWVQVACHHPIVRTHAARIAESDRRFWLWGEPYGRLMADALARRRELAAYIDTANHIAAETGVAAVHGLWIDHPARAQAHDPARYAFGDDLVVAPALAPAGEDWRTEVAGWLPPGRWFDLAGGELIDGDAQIGRRYALHEVPVFARAGACIPIYPGAGRLGDPATALRIGWEIIPGADGGGRRIEDDGRGADWRRAAIGAARVVQATLATRVELAAWTGGHPGCAEERDIELRFSGGLAAAGVAVDGVELPCADGAPGWGFDARRCATVVRLGRRGIRRGIAVEVRWHRAPASVPLLAIASRAGQAFAALRAAFHDAMRPLARLAQTPRRIALDPGRAAAELDALGELRAAARAAAHDALAGLAEDGKRAAAQRAALELTLRLLDGMPR